MDTNNVQKTADCQMQRQKKGTWLGSHLLGGVNILSDFPRSHQAKNAEMRFAEYYLNGGLTQFGVTMKLLHA